MADEGERKGKLGNPKSFQKHTRERFFHFLKLVREKLPETESSTSEESEDEIDQAELSPRNKRRRVQYDAQDNELSDKNEANSKRKNKKQERASQDDRADINKYIDSNSDADSVQSEETYWLENEVVFIPANQSKFPLKYVVKEKKRKS